jgi:uncharacterized HhH-GPD family protein
MTTCRDTIGASSREVLVSHQPSLPWTGDPASDAFIGSDPLALLVGFVLDQQVTVQKAFSGPLELRSRLGDWSAEAIANADPERLAALFAERPALHRFPGSMARRVQEVCAAIVSDYGGDASRIWSDGADAATVKRRLLELPGVGDMKASSILAVLVKRLGVPLAGADAVLPRHPTLGDVDTPEALADYQAGKRARKAELRAQGKGR